MSEANLREYHARQQYNEAQNQLGGLRRMVSDLARALSRKPAPSLPEIHAASHSAVRSAIEVYAGWCAANTTDPVARSRFYHILNMARNVGPTTESGASTP
jgi:hypothetical protein